MPLMLFSYCRHLRIICILGIFYLILISYKDFCFGDNNDLTLQFAPVLSLDFSPDGDQLVETTFNENSINILDAGTGQVETIIPSGLQVSNVAKFVNKNVIVTKKYDNKTHKSSLVLYEVATGELVWSSKEMDGDIISIATFSPKKIIAIAIGYRDFFLKVRNLRVQLWDMNKNMKIKEFTNQKYWKYNPYIFFSYDGNYLLAYAGGKRVTVINMADFTMRDVNIGNSIDLQIGYHEDKNQVIFGDKNGDIIILNFITGERVKINATQGMPILCIGISKHFLVSGGESSVKIFQKDTKKLLYDVNVMKYVPSASVCAIDRSGKYLAFGSTRGDLGLWDILKKKLLWLWECPYPEDEIGKCTLSRYH